MKKFGIFLAVVIIGLFFGQPVEVKSETTFKSFPIAVDLEISLEEMICSGKYDFINSDITSQRFSLKDGGKKKIVIILVHFNRFMEADDVYIELKRLGLRQAKIEELLAFGAKYPEVQKEFPVLALGSLWGFLGVKYAPTLFGDSKERTLSLFVTKWFLKEFRFLAIRK